MNVVFYHVSDSVLFIKQNSIYYVYNSIWAPVHCYLDVGPHKAVVIVAQANSAAKVFRNVKRGIFDLFVKQIFSNKYCFQDALHLIIELWLGPKSNLSG